MTGEPTICVWCPTWSLGRPDAPSDTALVVVGAPVDGVSRVVAADPVATSAGVRRGMPRREAEGACPGATVLVRDLDEETRRFEPVVSLITEIVPRVEVTEPGSALVPVAGAVRYHGGVDVVLASIAGKLAAAGVDARLGLADGPFAATWAARSADTGEPLVVEDTRTFLADLDVATIGHDDLVSTFRWLGVTTLGALARMPRDAIASRFGPVGLTAHRLASGEDRPLDPRPIPPGMEVEERWEDPLVDLDQVAFAARMLSARLMSTMKEAGTAPHRVVVTAEAESGDLRERVWRSADPFTEDALADRVWWQMRAWLESDGPGSGIIRLRLDPQDLSGDGRQLGFFTDESLRVEAERALARAQTLVGPDAVLEASRQGGRLPSEQVAWSRWQEEVVVDRDPSAPWPGATPGPAPALVPPEPVGVEVEWDGGLPVRIRLGSRWEPVLSWAGPWRSTGAWWRGVTAFDRYQLVTSAGAFLCVVRDGRTYLAGVYD